MRKVKIEHGFLVDDEGHKIECPVNGFAQCHTSCAWFLVDAVAHQLSVPGCFPSDIMYSYTDACNCHGKLIGELVNA